MAQEVQVLREMTLAQVNKFNLVIFSALIFSPGISTAQADNPSLANAHEAERIMKEVYNQEALSLNMQEKETIKELLLSILESNGCEQAIAACAVVNKLETALKKNREQTAENSADARKKQLHLFVLQRYIECLNAFTDQHKTHCSYLERLKIYFAKSGMELFQSKKVKSLVQLLTEYLQIEYSQILLIRSRAQTFLRRHQSRELPPLIEFWHDGTAQEKLLRRINRVEPEVIAQFFEEIAMMGMQSILFGGSSMYNSWLGEQSQKIFDEYTKKQNQIQDDFSQYLKQLSNDQQAIAKSIVKGFADAQTKLQKQFSDLNTQQKQETSYLLRSLSLVLPLERYLASPPVSYDQLFEASSMYTPGNGQWYNMFQVQQTDWEYDPLSKSFVQYGAAPFGTPYWSDKDNGTDPSQSSIFTEYIAPKRAYELEIEITLLNASYPFFLGIEFNRGHWISGDPEKPSQYRLLGIYGQQDAQKQSTLTVNFAEQKITIDKNVETLAAPLELIATDQKTKLATVPAAVATDLVRDPQHFIFSIQSQRSIITYTVTHKKANNQTEPIASGTLNDLSKDLAIHSGIGFMAVGCQASFKINKPTTLQYSTDQLNTFIKTMQKIITDFAKNTGGN